ncbi:MAG: OsmC family protein [Firmicutes bacterium]|nr:OsmC family protein [Alicyclobacillaceae bacterium]MCL6496099.1 OsmC family protein [Bacillota bacterium]
MMTCTADVRWTGQKTTVEATVRGHRLVVDEPVAMGGDDRGPTPIEYLLTALGSCLTIVVISLAPRFGVEVRGVQVHVEGDLDPEAMMRPEAGGRPGLQAVRVRIEVDSPAPREAVDALVARAESVCPVRDTLRGVAVALASDSLT